MSDMIYKQIDKSKGFMYIPNSCKKKEKQTISSRLTTLRPAKRKAGKIWLPASYSIKSKFPPVYLQHYGNCTSNAVLGCDDYLYHGSGKWIPSTTFTYYLQKRNERPMIDDGSSVEEALKKVKKYGACNSKYWPNDAPWNERPSEEAFADGLKGKEIKKWYILKNLKQLKQALVSGYPVAAAVAWVFKEYDENYVMNYVTKEEADKCDYGHAIVFVGYNDSTELIEFRNSWGSEWANDGYAYMTYEIFRNVIWWNDTYAVMK